MGVCHSEGKKKTGKNETTNQIYAENEGGAIEDPIKLRVAKRTLHPKDNEYNVNWINKNDNTETKITIKGNQILSQLLKDKMNLNENADYEIEFENGQKIQNDKKDNECGEILQSIFGKDIPEIISMKFLYKGLDLPENAIQSYIEDNTIIGSAVLDNAETFGIITYDINTKLISSYNYNISDYPILNNINNFTAYCNAKGLLYFSGGESEITNDLDKTSLKYKDFFALNLTTLTNDKLEINELPNLNEPRTWHSMIYVPNKYIFIVGGSNTKLVELYDIEQKKLTKDSKLNEIRCECTLCLVNNMYLYAFCGFIPQKDYNNSIERCNLFKENRSWEKIDTIERCKIKFNPSFFAISYYQNNDLILIGGNDQGEAERADYIYKIAKEENEKDEIEEYKFDLQDKVSIFKDKLFVPTMDNKAINIPLIIADEIKVVIFDRENGEVNTNDF